MNWSRNYSQFLDIRKRVQPPFALRVTVLERVHSTVHNMLAMYSNLSFDNWAELLPFVQLAHNTAYSTTLQETPHFLMFGRAAVLPVDLILGVRSTSAPQTQLDYSKQTVENLQLAYERPAVT